jgi:hypothetical protein
LGKGEKGDGKRKGKAENSATVDKMRQYWISVGLKANNRCPCKKAMKRHTGKKAM